MPAPHPHLTYKDRGDVRARIFKRGLGIDSKESILSAYAARRADTTTLFLIGSSPQ